MLAEITVHLYSKKNRLPGGWVVWFVVLCVVLCCGCVVLLHNRGYLHHLPDLNVQCGPSHLITCVPKPALLRVAGHSFF